jgi:hypothetical protein
MSGTEDVHAASIVKTDVLAQQTLIFGLKTQEEKTRLVKTSFKDCTQWLCFD